MNKKIAILAEDLFEDLELLYPKLRLLEEGLIVKILAPENREYKGKYGYPVKPDSIIKNENPKNYDAVIIPGGYCPDRLRRYPEAINFVKEIFKQGKIVAAICHGVWIPVSAGILKGKKATCFFAIKDDIINAGATYFDKEVIVDKNLITSRKPEDLPAFCKEIIKALL